MLSSSGLRLPFEDAILPLRCRTRNSYRPRPPSIAKRAGVSGRSDRRTHRRKQVCLHLRADCHNLQRPLLSPREPRSRKITPFSAVTYHQGQQIRVSTRPRGTCKVGANYGMRLSQAANFHPSTQPEIRLVPRRQTGTAMITARVLWPWASHQYFSSGTNAACFPPVSRYQPFRNKKCLAHVIVYGMRRSCAWNSLFGACAHYSYLLPFPYMPPLPLT